MSEKERHSTHISEMLIHLGASQDAPRPDADIIFEMQADRPGIGSGHGPKGKSGRNFFAARKPITTKNSSAAACVTMK